MSEGWKPSIVLSDKEKEQNEELKNKYPIKFVDHVLDNVHGNIELTKVERQIVDLPIFTRLQSIKQLSLVNWIFPGAEHTRYTHSLGVMYVADKMAIQLKFSPGDRQIIRLAGLLHDIGHYPLSHVGESVYKESIIEPVSKDDRIPKYVWQAKDKVKERIDHITDRSNYLQEWFEKEPEAHHENIGAMIIESNDQIASVIQKYCPFVYPDELRAIITGDYKHYLHIADKIQLLHSELDADRIDYLLRDASFSGATYGVFDLGVILKNLTWTNKLGFTPVGIDESVLKSKGFRIIGIKPKGVSSADQFMLNRFFAYTQIITNRHVVALEFMIETIMRQHESITFPSKNDMLTHYTKPAGKSNFINFTDYLFWKLV